MSRNSHTVKDFFENYITCPIFNNSLIFNKIKYTAIIDKRIISLLLSSRFEVGYHGKKIKLQFFYTYMLSIGHKFEIPS